MRAHQQKERGCKTAAYMTLELLKQPLKLINRLVHKLFY